MSNEFLRPRENRCKWINTLKKRRRSVYIVRVKRQNFRTKNNWIESIHLLIESIQTVERLNPGKGKYMKIDASQEMYETIQASQKDVWIDSR